MSINSNNRGFTLIELLVVIAIIGILASVVLASLNSARAKGADAATKSNLNNARGQAALFYDSGTTATYASMCSSATAGGIYPMALAARDSSGATTITNGTVVGTSSVVVCGSTATQWVLSAPLKSETGYWCVDSTGTSAKRTNPVAANAFVCPAT